MRAIFSTSLSTKFALISRLSPLWRLNFVPSSRLHSLRPLCACYGCQRLNTGFSYLSRRPYGTEQGDSANDDDPSFDPKRFGAGKPNRRSTDVKNRDSNEAEIADNNFSEDIQKGQEAEKKLDNQEDEMEEDAEKAAKKEDDENSVESNLPSVFPALRSSGSGSSSSSSTSLSRKNIPEHYPEVLCIPVSRRPLFPGFYKTVTIKNPNVASAVARLLKKGEPYVGLFMIKDSADHDIPTEEHDVERTSSAGTSPLEGPLVESPLTDEVVRSHKPASSSSTNALNIMNAEHFENEDTIRSLNDIHPMGSFAQIINIFPLKDAEGVTAIVYPYRRIMATELLSPLVLDNEEGRSNADPKTAPPSRVRVENVKELSFDTRDRVLRAMAQEIFSVLTEIAKLNPFFREQIAHTSVPSDFFDNPSQLADFVAVLVSSDTPSELQDVFSSMNVEDRLRKALMLLKKEYVSAQLQSSISKDVEQKINQRQREYFLNEQLKVIRKELGLESDSKEKILEGFRKKAAELTMPEVVKRAFQEEMNKLSVLESVGTEFNITRNYIDWITALPWGKTSLDQFSLAKSAKILDEDHYGLQDVKSRILEFIAVGALRSGDRDLGQKDPKATESSSKDNSMESSTPQKKTSSVQGKILCLVGPPGVGKTSIGKSIARALGRSYFRFSVGGLSDVSELKGHRRTYVGAMPGKMVQALKMTQFENPLILIDEVDKIGRAGHQGDPSSALLELLDPEQNSGFLDHYLDLPLDLSKVLFVCTANATDTIPPPLLDRMEVIQLSGYIMEEKMRIATDYLVPAAMRDCGLIDASGQEKDKTNSQSLQKPSQQVILERDALESLLKGYARESGVRSLKKLIEKIFRKAAYKIVLYEQQHQREGEEANKSSSNPEEENENNKPNPTLTGSLPDIIPPSSPQNSTVSFSPPQSLNNSTPYETSTPLTLPIVINSSNLYEYVGQPIFTSERLYSDTPPGVVTGLAWTSMGGSVLYIETTIDNPIEVDEALKTGKKSTATFGPLLRKRALRKSSTPAAVQKSNIDTSPSSGRLVKTGQLGKVMEESVQIAYTVAKRTLPSLLTQLKENNIHLHLSSREMEFLHSFFNIASIHLHIPEGATPKDGPSAGITVTTALLSLASGRPLPSCIAMTGEISLTGKVLRIGGLREKIIAAKRAGIRKVIFPKSNEADWYELPEMVKEGVEPHMVDSYQEVLHLCFIQP